MHFVVVWITLYETLFVDKQSISRYKHNMKEDVKKYLGLKVRAIREAAGMTQEELAATCDVSWRTISNLERGTVVPDLVMIYKISQEFNISIDEMLDNKIADNKSLSRLEKENQIIEKIRKIDDIRLVLFSKLTLFNLSLKNAVVRLKFCGLRILRLRQRK